MGVQRGHGFASFRGIWLILRAVDAARSIVRLAVGGAAPLTPDIRRLVKGNKMLKKARPVTFVFDERSEITPNDVWSVFVGYEYGPVLRVALSMIATIPVETLVKAIHNIHRVESIGPMMDPSAWFDGVKFHNARQYEAILRTLVSLRQLLPDMGQVRQHTPECGTKYRGCSPDCKFHEGDEGSTSRPPNSTCSGAVLRGMERLTHSRPPCYNARAAIVAAQPHRRTGGLAYGFSVVVVPSSFRWIVCEVQALQ